MHCFGNLINKHRVAGHHFILHWKFQKQNVYTGRARRPQSDDICTRHTALARRKTYSTAWVPGWWESSQCRGLESHDLSLEGKSLALHFVADSTFCRFHKLHHCFSITAHQSNLPILFITVTLLST